MASMQFQTSTTAGFAHSHVPRVGVKKALELTLETLLSNKIHLRHDVDVGDFQVDHRRQRCEDPREVLCRIIQKLRVQQITDVWLCV